MKRTFVALFLAGFLAACDLGSLTLNEQTKEAQGIARVNLFQQCMEMAAMNARVADDDVADVVKACDQVSYYQSAFIRVQ
jgi:hypothetical protein